ncbi:MAG: hypothetical protein IKC46_00455 [Lachnospiraceae bacterium]|nr:hypothetical protein [Lachnospiraceae bacterium]
MSNSIQEPAWMQEPAVRKIPKEKLLFLQKLVFESSTLSQKELLPFLMALAQKSKSSNISFSKEEMNAIIEAIKKHSSPAEIAKINQIMKLMASRY